MWLSISLHHIKPVWKGTSPPANILLLYGSLGGHFCVKKWMRNKATSTVPQTLVYTFVFYSLHKLFIVLSFHYFSAVQNNGLYNSISESLLEKIYYKIITDFSRQERAPSLD